MSFKEEDEGMDSFSGDLKEHDDGTSNIGWSSQRIIDVAFQAPPAQD